MTDRVRNAGVVLATLASLFALYLSAQAAFVSRREWDTARAADQKLYDARSDQLDRIESQIAELRAELVKGRRP